MNLKSQIYLYLGTEGVLILVNSPWKCKEDGLLPVCGRNHY